ncbi:MAG: hypothetical protein ACK56I_05360 [bacterium]
MRSRMVLRAKDPVTTAKVNRKMPCRRLRVRSRPERPLLPASPFSPARGKDCTQGSAAEDRLPEVVAGVPGKESRTGSEPPSAGSEGTPGVITCACPEL